MHEATIAASVLGIARRAVAPYVGARVTRIEVSIGRLKAVEPELLVSCFGFMSEDTPCAGAELACTLVPVTALCRDCGTVSDIARWRFECNACASTGLDILSGRELRVDRIVAH